MIRKAGSQNVYTGKLYRFQNQYFGDLDMIVAHEINRHNETIKEGKIIITTPLDSNDKLRTFMYESRPLLCVVNQPPNNHRLAEASYKYNEEMINVDKNGILLEWLCTNKLHAEKILHYKHCKVLRYRRVNPAFPESKERPCMPAFRFTKKSGSI